MGLGVKQGRSDEETEQSPEAPIVHGEKPDRGRSDRRRRRDRPRHLEASINLEELRQLVTLITENGVMDFELEREDFRVKVSRNTFRESPPAVVADAQAGKGPGAAPTIQGGQPVQRVPSAVPPHPGAQAEEAASEDQGLHKITSPIIGTFYRSPSPTSDTFVHIGDRVAPDTVVCVIEAMKLMNEIQAEASGEVVKIYVENGQAVEYGQPLFGIKQD